MDLSLTNTINESSNSLKCICQDQINISIPDQTNRSTNLCFSSTSKDSKAGRKKNVFNNNWSTFIKDKSLEERERGAV